MHGGYQEACFSSSAYQFAWMGMTTGSHLALHFTLNRLLIARDFQA
jgi:hypothetical protein